MIHRFAAISFKEDFVIRSLPPEWVTGVSVIDPKDYRIKPLQGGGIVFAYNFGALAFRDVEPDDREREIELFQKIHPTPLTERTTNEEFIVEERPGEQPRVEFSRLVLDTLTPPRSGVIALTLAQSAAMEYYEKIVVATWRNVSALIQGLEKKGRVAGTPRQLHRLIGEAITMRSEVVGVLHLLDPPDVIWDDGVMDSLYPDLRAVFDLGERFKALEYKIHMIQDALELLVDMARDRRLYTAEMTIVVLIVIEIIMTLVQWAYF